MVVKFGALLAIQQDGGFLLGKMFCYRAVLFLLYVSMYTEQMLGFFSVVVLTHFAFIISSDLPQFSVYMFFQTRYLDILPSIFVFAIFRKEIIN